MRSCMRWVERRHLLPHSTCRNISHNGHGIPPWLLLCGPGKWHNPRRSSPPAKSIERRHPKTRQLCYITRGVHVEADWATLLLA